VYLYNRETHGDAAFGGSVSVKDVTLVNWTAPRNLCGGALQVESS
jgi:hypothetical protein